MAEPEAPQRLELVGEHGVADASGAAGMEDGTWAWTRRRGLGRERRRRRDDAYTHISSSPLPLYALCALLACLSTLLYALKFLHLAQTPLARRTVPSPLLRTAFQETKSTQQTDAWTRDSACDREELYPTDFTPLCTNIEAHLENLTGTVVDVYPSQGQGPPM